MKLYYPHKPYVITQKWGNLNGAYAEQFDDPNFKRHNGIDSITGKSDFWVVCPVEGFRVSRIQFMPTGGGNELWLESKNKMVIGDKECYVRLLFCHAKKILVKVGDEPSLGELLMISDNTGFSTGAHLHMGMYRIDARGRKIDINDSTGSYDPSLFFTFKHAIDEASTATLMKSGLRYMAYLLG